MAMFWFLLVVCVCWPWILQSCSQSAVPVKVSPDKNYTVYYDSGQNVSYDCVVETGEPVWEIKCFQFRCVSVQLNTDKLKYQSRLWLVVDVAANQSKLILREEAWRERGNLRIVCQSHSTDSTVLLSPVSKEYYIITYGPLEDPSKLNLSIDSNNTHHFSWTSPSVPQDVKLSCYVTAMNLSSGVMLLNTSTNKQTVRIFNYSSRSDCSEVTFFVYCANEEDDSIRTSMINKTENLPLSPNVFPLEQSFTVLVELKASLISLEILTKTANICSPSYPVTSYIVNVVSEQGVKNAVTFDPSDNDSEEVFRLSSTDAPVLTLDQVLKISVTVCSNITCHTTAHTTPNFTVFTTQVQNPGIIYSNRSVAFVCDVLQSSQATGCYFNLTTVSIDGSMTSEVFTVSITSELKSQCPSEYCTISMCGVTDSLPTNYLSIDAYAIINNRTVSDFGQPVRLVNGSEMDTAGEYSNCFKVETQEPNSRARVVGGIVGGVLGLIVLIISVVAVVLFAVLIVFRKRSKSRSFDMECAERSQTAENAGNARDDIDGSDARIPLKKEISVNAKVRITKESGKARIKVILDKDCMNKIDEEVEWLLS